jgi:demethylmenaquinone methyltransferase/2-methoxy-6-polyprenyl-1,4-benzoquinol methylase
MNAAEQMQTYYAARASEYDGVYRKPERQPDLRAIEEWLPTLFDRKNVIEIACGTGYWTQFIAPKASRVLGVDATPETLEIAKARVPGDTVDFRVGDAYSLPRQDPKFDAAFAGFWFSHVPLSRRKAFLAGVNQVVKPGSKIVLLDNRFVEGNSTPISEQDDEGNTFQVRTLGNGSRHRVLKNFPTHAELDLAIEGLGARGIFKQWQYFWAFEYVTSDGR